MKNKGLLIVLSGPSGAGKGTVHDAVLSLNQNVKKSISVTTRLPRKGEKEGVHYFFKSLTEFQQMCADGDFLETASVYSNNYGTPKAEIFRTLEAGYDVILEIDTNGARQIKRNYPQSVMIFLMTPSFKQLKEQLVKRATEDDDSLKNRLSNAKSELNEYRMFDYIVINNSVSSAANKIVSIIEAEKSKVELNDSLIKELLSEEF
jgi:guanylate kinase